ncbi:MAG: hypothetical protein Q9216_003944 [Gyalolechia sp. 2 TL-2023]
MDLTYLAFACIDLITSLSTATVSSRAWAWIDRLSTSPSPADPPPPPQKYVDMSSVYTTADPKIIHNRKAIFRTQIYPVCDLSRYDDEELRMILRKSKKFSEKSYALGQVVMAQLRRAESMDGRKSYRDASRLYEDNVSRLASSLFRVSLHSVEIRGQIYVKLGLI